MASSMKRRTSSAPASWTAAVRMCSAVQPEMPLARPTFSRDKAARKVAVSSLRGGGADVGELRRGGGGVEFVERLRGCLGRGGQGEGGELICGPSDVPSLDEFVDAVSLGVCGGAPGGTSGGRQGVAGGSMSDVYGFGVWYFRGVGFWWLEVGDQLLANTLIAALADLRYEGMRGQMEEALEWGRVPDSLRRSPFAAEAEEVSGGLCPLLLQSWGNAGRGASRGAPVQDGSGAGACQRLSSWGCVAEGGGALRGRQRMVWSGWWGAWVRSLGWASGPLRVRGWGPGDSPAPCVSGRGSS